MRRGRASVVGGDHFVTLSVFPSIFPILPFGVYSANQQLPSLSIAKPYAVGLSSNRVNFPAFGSNIVNGPPVAHTLPCAKTRTLRLIRPAPLHSHPGE